MGKIYDLAWYRIQKELDAKEAKHLELMGWNSKEETPIAQTAEEKRAEHNKRVLREYKIEQSSKGG